MEAESIFNVEFSGEYTSATGRIKRKPYAFEIVNYFRDLGYTCEVVDYYPAPDGNGFCWKANIKKRNPMIVTDKEYHRITNCSGLDSWNVRFGIEEMQQILIDNGYEIIVHSAKAEINETASEFGSGEVRRTGRKWIENVERIFAVKPEDKLNLPEWNDSYRASCLDFTTVFNNLIKAKLFAK